MTTTLTSIDSATLARSQAVCRRVTRHSARNFYYGLKLLPPAKRAALFALYAYMRAVDDIADREDGRKTAQRMDELETWRQHTHAAAAGRCPPDGCGEFWPAFIHALAQYAIPVRLFDDVIAGQRQDLEGIAFETFDQLREYCYRVAGVVGLASIHVWGFDGGAETEQLAVDRGIAFQLTNILRDLREDLSRGRVYLPRQELREAGVSEGDLRSAVGTDRFAALLARQVERAESYYRISAPLETRIAADCRPALMAMTQIYHGLLRKIAARPQRILRERVSLSTLAKLRIGWRALRSR